MTDFDLELDFDLVLDFVAVFDFVLTLDFAISLLLTVAAPAYSSFREQLGAQEYYMQRKYPARGAIQENADISTIQCTRGIKGQLWVDAVEKVTAKKL